MVFKGPSPTQTLLRFTSAPARVAEFSRPGGRAGPRQAEVLLATRQRLRLGPLPSLSFRGPSHEAPIHADGLPHQLLAVQPLHGRLRLFIGFVLDQSISLGSGREGGSVSRGGSWQRGSPVRDRTRGIIPSQALFDPRLRGRAGEGEARACVASSRRHAGEFKRPVSQKGGSEAAEGLEGQAQPR